MGLSGPRDLGARSPVPRSHLPFPPAAYVLSSSPPAEVKWMHKSQKAYMTHVSFLLDTIEVQGLLNITYFGSPFLHMGKLRQRTVF